MTKFNEQIAGDKPVLVEFFAAWCPHCQRMVPRIEELKRIMGAKLKVVQLDIDSPANDEAIRHFHVDTMPTFILFDHGKQTWRDSGEYELDDLVATIRQYI